MGCPCTVTSNGPKRAIVREARFIQKEDSPSRRAFPSSLSTAPSMVPSTVFLFARLRFRPWWLPILLPRWPQSGLRPARPFAVCRPRAAKARREPWSGLTKGVTDDDPGKRCRIASAGARHRLATGRHPAFAVTRAGGRRRRDCAVAPERPDLDGRRPDLAGRG